jgi:putative sigma-54 modulation protein
MDVQIKTRDLKMTDGLQEYIDNRVERLGRVQEPVIDAILELRGEKRRSGGEITIAQFTIRTRSTILRTEEKDHDPHVAIDQAVDRMERQIRRYRDKKIFVPRRRRRAQANQAMEVDIPPTDEVFDILDSEGEEQDLEPRTPVRHKRFSVLPMDETEAIEQMELLGHDFFVFFNPDDGQINVLYRRHDGEYGVIQPELK